MRKTTVLMGMAAVAVVSASASAEMVSLFRGAGGGTPGPWTFTNVPNPGTAVNSLADLGVPGAGSFRFSGNAFGGIGGSNGAFAAAHNGGGAIANMNQMASVGVDFGTDFSSPVTRVADAGAGDLLFADFAQAGGFTGNQSTEISFGLASFGNQNSGKFKYNFVRGLDGSGNEVFELLFVAGSGNELREVYARGADDDSTTLTGENSGTPEGTKIVESSSFGFNGTNVANGRPGSTWQVNILLEDGMVKYTIGGNGNVVTTAAMDGAFAINSGATSIASLEFSSIWNLTEENGNKGYWVDDIFASTVIPAPGAVSLLGLGCLASAGRRRR